jgi:hypothetical protein
MTEVLDEGVSKGASNLTVYEKSNILNSTKTISQR